MIDYSKMSDFEINKRVAIALDIDMHFFIPESEDSFGIGFAPSEMGPIWQTSANFVGGLNVSNGNKFNPCNNPSDAWPIISKNKISLIGCLDMWIAAPYSSVIDGDTSESQALMYVNSWKSPCLAHQNPIRAAMIVFLMMQDEKIG